MELERFIQNFEEQFDEVKEGSITAETEYKSIEEYGSLTAMGIIAMVDSEYGVTISGDILKKSETVKDLFEIVKANK